MKVLFALVRREYLARVRRKGFLIGTVLTPLLAVAVFAIPILAVTRGGGERQVAVLDQSGDAGLFEAVKRALDAQRGGTRFVLTRIVVPEREDIETLRRTRTAELIEDSDRACLVLGRDVLDGTEPGYFARNVTDNSLEAFGRAVSGAILERRLARSGLSPDEVARATRPAPLKTVKVSPEGESQESGQAFLTATIVVLTLFSTILGHSASVLNGIVEEKESRIVELLITSVEPYQIMFGKLFGIGLVGLTQYAIWGASVLLARGAFRAAAVDTGVDLSSIGGSVLLTAALFFLLGYFLFATLYLIVGAAASRPEDAHQLARPLFILNVVPWLIFYAVMKDPGGALAVTLSFIPFFTPTLMTVRIIVGATPAWQVALSVALTLGTIVGLLWVAARVYRASILIYGKKLTLGELRRSLRHG